MSINATLLGQMITFILFVLFTMKYVWPPLTNALNARQKKIADGLAAAERGQHELAVSERRAVEYLKEAKEKANSIVEQANKQGDLLIEEAKKRAYAESEVLIASARQEASETKAQIRKAIEEEVVTVAMLAAEKFLAQKLDATNDRKIIAQLIEEL